MKHLTFFALAILSLSALQAQPGTGKKAPDIALPNSAGIIRKLSEHEGKVVLVDFWASWCGPCRKTNPALVKLYAKFKNDGFEIFGISIDDDKAAWKNAIIKDKMPWTHVLETGGWNGPVASAWKIQQIPSSYLLDRSGKLVAVDLSVPDLEKKIAQLLKGSI